MPDGDSLPPEECTHIQVEQSECEGQELTILTGALLSSDGDDESNLPTSETCLTPPSDMSWMLAMDDNKQIKQRPPPIANDLCSSSVISLPSDGVDELTSPPKGMGWLLDVNKPSDGSNNNKSQPSGMNEMESDAKESFDILVQAIQNGAIELRACVDSVEPESSTFQHPLACSGDESIAEMEDPKMRSDTSSYISVVPMCMYLWSGTADSDHCKVSLTTLPHDCLIIICSYLALQNILLASTLSTEFRDATGSDLIWKDYFTSKFACFPGVDISDVLQGHKEYIEDVSVSYIAAYYGRYPLRKPDLVLSGYRKQYVESISYLSRTLNDKKEALISLQKRRVRIGEFFDTAHDGISNTFWIFVLAGQCLFCGALATMLVDARDYAARCFIAAGCCLIVLGIYGGIEIHRLSFMLGYCDSLPGWLRPEHHPNTIVVILISYCMSYFLFVARFMDRDDPNPFLRYWIVVISPIILCNAYYVVSLVCQICNKIYSHKAALQSNFGCMCVIFLSPLWLSMLLHAIRQDIGNPECQLAWVPLYVGSGLLSVFIFTISLYSADHTSGLSLWYGFTVLLFMTVVVLAAHSSCNSTSASLGLSTGLMLVSTTVSWGVLTVYLQNLLY